MILQEENDKYNNVWPFVSVLYSMYIMVYESCTSNFVKKKKKKS